MITTQEINWFKRALGFVILCIVAVVLAWQIAWMIADSSTPMVGETVLVAWDNYLSMMLVLVGSLAVNLVIAGRYLLRRLSH